MNTALRLLPALSFLAIVGCYGDKVFVEDGAGGDTPTSTSTSGGAPPSGGNGNGGAAGGEAPGGGGGEAPTGCTTPADCPNPSSDCVDVTCEAMLCGEDNKPQGDGCADGFCDGGGSCVECLSTADCSGSDTCDPTTHVCVSPQCSNGNLDTGETDTDCGGSMCPPCPNMDSCLIGTDCASGFCNVSLVCAPCALDSNCDTITQYCDSGTCAPKEANGSACLDNSECQSAACVPTSVGNICCNTGCSGACMSCAMVDTGQPNGTCSNVTPNTDPENECPAQPCRTGTCGTAGCGISAPNSSCNDNLFCNGTDTCTSTGTCSHSGSPCPAEAIPDFNCSESCNEAQDNCSSPDPVGTPCTDGFFCSGTADTCNGAGTCQGNGNPCPGHNQAPFCNDSCNETADSCFANDVAGTQCDQDNDGSFGVCTTNGACMGD